METIIYKGYTIQIEQDTDSLNPREDFDNLGSMVCFHRKYTLGDKKEFSSPESFKEWLKANEKDLVLLPLYLLDHSGITISTDSERFRACDPQGWDWGRVGVIYVSKEKIRKEYSLKRNVTKARIEQVKNLLRSEVKTYDDYLTGNVYGYTIKAPDGEDLDDACWGFFGDPKDSGLIEEAKAAIDHTITYRLKTEGEQQTLSLTA